MRLFFSTHRRPVSTFVALSQGLQKAYPVPDELPELNCSGIRTVRSLLPTGRDRRPSAMRRQQLKDKAEVDSRAHPSGESVPGFPVDRRLTLRAPTLFSGGSTVGSYAVLTVLPHLIGHLAGGFKH